MIRPYETMVVLDGTAGEDVIAKEMAAIEQFFSENGEIEKVNPWGKRELAYEIAKKRIGFYCLYQYKAEGDIAARFDTAFKLSTVLLRHITLIRELNKRTLVDAEALRAKRVEEGHIDADEAEGGHGHGRDRDRGDRD